MAVTFRDRVDLERGSVGADGTLGDFQPVARQVPAAFWEYLVKRVAVEGEVFEATAEALLEYGTDARRHDVIVARDRRWEVLTSFQGRNIGGEGRFVHVTLREAA